MTNHYVYRLLPSCKQNYYHSTILCPTMNVQTTFCFDSLGHYCLLVFIFENVLFLIVNQFKTLGQCTLFQCFVPAKYLSKLVIARFCLHSVSLHHICGDFISFCLVYLRFISELLTLLVCMNEHTSLQLRNTVKESLGFDLSIPLYPSFFALCKATTACFFDDNGQVSSSSLLY